MQIQRYNFFLHHHQLILWVSISFQIYKYCRHQANSPVVEDHPLNPNPSSNWQTFFKYVHNHHPYFFSSALIFYVTRKLTLSLFLSNGDLFSKLCLDRDNDVLLQIDKDVRRLCPDLTFFKQVEKY